MTTFKEISIEDYKKLLDNKLHTYGKLLKISNYYKNLKKKNLKIIT